MDRLFPILFIRTHVFPSIQIIYFLDNTGNPPQTIPFLPIHLHLRELRTTQLLKYPSKDASLCVVDACLQYIPFIVIIPAYTNALFYFKRMDGVFFILTYKMQEMILPQFVDKPRFISRPPAVPQVHTFFLRPFLSLSFP